MRPMARILTVLATIGGLAFASPIGVASASNSATADSDAARCVTLLTSPDPVTRIADIASQVCYSGPDAQSRQQSAMSAQALAGSFLLVSFYDAANYGGGSDVVYGSAPCDTFGYGISDMGQIHKNVRWGLWGGVSSYRVWNNCNMSEMFTSKTYGGTASGWYYGDTAYVGDTFNDSFGSFWIKKAP